MTHGQEVQLRYGVCLKSSMRCGAPSIQHAQGCAPSPVNKLAALQVGGLCSAGEGLCFAGGGLCSAGGELCSAGGGALQVGACEVCLVGFF